MTAWLQTQEAVRAVHDTSRTWRLLDAPEPWVSVLVVLPLCGALALLCYWREPIGTRARCVLVALRLLALLLLFLVLCRPVRVLRREQVHAPRVLLLLDDSASMLRRDAYGEDSPARASLAAASGREPAAASRLELEAAAVERVLLPELARRGYEVALYGFSDEPRALGSLSELSGRGRATQIGDAVERLLTTQRAQHVTDLLLISDGRSNGGVPVGEAARAARLAGVPVHTAVVGDTRAPVNASIELLESPASALTGDELSFVVRVTGRGTRPGERVSVALEELEAVPGEGAANARTLDAQEALLVENGERVLLSARSEGLDERARERRFRASIPAVSGETLTDDNQIEFSVHVSDQKVRVLYVDGYPRWEYRFLALHLLKRTDAHISFQALLRSSTPDFRQESSRDLPALDHLPDSRKELLDNYDVVLLGDVGPYDVDDDPARCSAFWDALVEFVEAGGGVLFEAGESANPRAFLGTRVEDLLPVVVDAAEYAAVDGSQIEFRPVLEDPRNPHEILRLSTDAEENRRLWEDPDGLRGFYWYFPVSRPKPGAQVLARHPDQGNEHGRHALIVAGYHPAGRTLFLAFDSTWRWRYHYGDRYHERFWRNALRWLSLGRLKSGDRRFRIETARSNYDLDERVALEARVLDEDFRPSTAGAQAARWSAPDGRPQDIELPAVPGQPGTYRAVLECDRPGLYHAWIEREGARLTSTEFEVVLPSRENADPTPDPAAMALLARESGGKALELGRLEELLAEFPGGEDWREPISSRLLDAWDHWGTLALALAVLAFEWILRKRWELV